MVDMSSSKLPITSAATPKYCIHHDIWNSSSTGHQRAENRLSTSIGWRESRSMRLSHQFKSRVGERRQISDQGVVRSDSNDKKREGQISEDGKTQATVGVADIFLSKTPFAPLQNKVCTELRRPIMGAVGKTIRETLGPNRRIFDGLTIYVNGCTKPLISDHRLKYLLAENGAMISIHFGWRRVTHVILGNPCRKTGIMGAGGGLGGSKIQKEIMRIGGRGIRYVNVQWVLESIKAGIRLPEARFSNLTMASKGQRSIYDSMFKAVSSISEPSINETRETGSYVV